MERSSSVRKGAWTEEEDILLSQCINKYGEGKWHHVPLKAGRVYSREIEIISYLVDFIITFFFINYLETLREDM